LQAASASAIALAASMPARWKLLDMVLSIRSFSPGSWAKRPEPALERSFRRGKRAGPVSGALLSFKNIEKSA